MPRSLILGKLDPDLACALAVGLVEHPLIQANLEAISLYDQDLTLIGRYPDWLDVNDPLDAATRAYLEARRTAHEARRHHEDDNAWAAAASLRVQEDASKRAIAARSAARQLLEEREVLASARAAGMAVLG
jgi:hypothetical protein